MGIPFYAKNAENQGYIKNMEVAGYHDLNGIMAFQMALHKTEDGCYYLYCGSFKGSGQYDPERNRSWEHPFCGLFRSV